MTGSAKTKHLLFVCGKARMRSPTAAQIFAQDARFDSDFAGLSNDADEPISRDQIEWADVIYVMEQRQKKRLNTIFGSSLKTKRVVCLNIPDNYEYMQPELVKLLKRKLAGLF